MIICSCTVITVRHIEEALIEILNEPDAPIPTPGVIFRHLSRKMNCCGCAPLVVGKIYELVDKLEAEGRICPYAGATAKVRLRRLTVRRGRRHDEASSDEANHSPQREGELTSV
jgi:hypothetical protein